MSHIYSEPQILKFHSLLYDKYEEGNYFGISSIFRDKYISKMEDKKKYRSLMQKHSFNREIVKGNDPQTYLDYVYRLNKLIPDDGREYFVIYGTINPASHIKVLKQAQIDITDYLVDCEKRKVPHLYDEHIKKLCFHPSYINRKNWIDIDIDIPYLREKDSQLSKFYEEFLPFFTNTLAHNNPTQNYHVIETRSGCHILLEKDSLKFDYTSLITVAESFGNSLFNGYIECKVNYNMLIPIPGTMQNGFGVKFYERG